MKSSRTEIMSRLQKEILSLQGFRQPEAGGHDAGLHLIHHAFPNSRFPLGAIHEFFCSAAEETSASSGFISAITAFLMKNGGPVIWISSSQTIFPPALQSFGIDPARVIFIHLKKEKEKLWAMEEVLKCPYISSVIGEINEFTFTESRRLQLAVEQSRVTGFIIRLNPKNLSTASVARWKIRPLADQQREVPGLGFPGWDISLLKIRNGKPGRWQMVWKNQKFYFIQKSVFISTREERKISRA